MRKLRKPHAYTKRYQAVKCTINNEILYGPIISRIHKLPKTSTIEEPYYLVTGIGAAVWEGHLKPISDSEYTQATKGGL